MRKNLGQLEGSRQKWRNEVMCNDPAEEHLTPICSLNVVSLWIRAKYLKCKCKCMATRYEEMERGEDEKNQRGGERSEDGGEFVKSIQTVL